MNSLNKSKDTEKAALVIAVLLTAIWIVGIFAILIFYPAVLGQLQQDQNLTALLLVGLFLPLAMIWTAALLARSMASMRNEANALRQSVEKMRKTLEVQVAEESETRDRWIQSQLAQIKALTKQTDSRVSALSKKTGEEAPQKPALRSKNAMPLQPTDIWDEDQEPLPLPKDGKIPAAPITIRELIKALNFPDNANDVEGFKVLRRAFNDHDTAKLLQASQDTLTMLSEDGIYMDDLRVEKPAVSAWRAFANGTRGQDVAALGMVRDRTALTLSRARLKNDANFRETVHGFLHQFDTVLSGLDKTADDAEILEMGKTRSALAFMLLGRVSGVFDPV